MLRLLLLLLTVSLLGCSSQTLIPDDHCASQRILADAHFEGGMLGKCLVSAEGEFELTIFPEDKPPINVSPWYAFRLSGTPGENVTVRIEFQDGFARYWPKVSQDGESWSRLPDDQVSISESGTRMEIRVEMEQAQLWIAGQELITGRYYDDWIRELSATTGVTTRWAGTSVQGRPIYMAEAGDSREVLILLGRQHPPEVTGPVAMRPFVATLLADNELAARFRERFRLIILPLLNPDGVALGYWRHNVNGIDLNRDWGPFTQPETRIMRDWLADPAQANIRLQLMLDFHSTQKNVFYTQRDVDPTIPADFTRRWLERSADRLPDYEFDREAGDTFTQPNSKNYFYTRYGIPAITYETGDETSRPAMIKAAVVFAEEMMRLLLEYPAGE